MSFYRKAMWFYKSWQDYTQTGFAEASKNFDATDLDVDLKGKSFMITGATSDIGKILTEEIAKRGGIVHMVCRNMPVAEVIRYSLIDKTNNQEIYLHVVDLAHPRSVYSFTQEFKNQYESLDCLIHNAGCMIHTLVIDSDGLERNFATNVLSPHIITRQFIPLLHKSEKGRVIFISSGSMIVHRLDPTDIQCQNLSKYDGMHVYAHNKRQQVVMTEVYSREYPKLFCAAMHPGWTDTEGLQKSLPEFYVRMKGRLRTPEQGADTALWLAVSRKPLLNTSGLFYQDRMAVTTHLPFSFTKPSLQEEESFIKQLDHLMEKLIQ